MIIINNDGTYTVKVMIDGDQFTDTFDELYEAEACEEQYNIFLQSI